MAVGTALTEKENCVSVRKDIVYYHSWILFISQLNSKEETTPPSTDSLPVQRKGKKSSPPNFISPQGWTFRNHCVMLGICSANASRFQLKD